MSPSVLIPRGNSLCQSGRAKVRGVEILLLRLTPSIILRIMNREETMCASFTRSQCLLGASVWSWAVGCRARAERGQLYRGLLIPHLALSTRVDQALLF